MCCTFGDAEVLRKAELGGHEILDAGADGGDLDAAGDVGGEGVGHEVAGLGEREAARDEVEDGVFVDWAGGAAVGAFDVVGVNLKGGLGVHEDFVGEQERFAGLLGVGFLGVFLDEDFAFEDGHGFVGEDVLVKFVAGAVAFFVLKQGVIVDVLVAAGVDEAVERGFGALAAEEDLEVVACEAAAETRGMADENTLGIEGDLHQGGVVGGIALDLQFVVIDARIGGLDDFGHGVGEVDRGILAGVGFDDGGFAVFLRDHQHARMAGGRCGRGHGDEEQVDRFFAEGAAGQMDECAFADEAGVEGGEGVLVDLRVFPQMLFEQLSIALERLPETLNGDAFGQAGDFA